MELTEHNISFVGLFQYNNHLFMYRGFHYEGKINETALSL